MSDFKNQIPVAIYKADEKLTYLKRELQILKEKFPEPKGVIFFEIQDAEEKIDNLLKTKQYLESKIK